MIKIDIGGISIGIENKFEYIERLSENYLTEDEPVFTVLASFEDMEKERESSGINAPPWYLESIVAYRNIAEMLPKLDAFVFHGSVLALDGKAYIFAAKSGVGKTTHTRLWLSEFSDECYVLNGDKPVIRLVGDEFFVAGTPWRGKEGFGVHETLPLGGIAFLERGEENSASRMSISDALTRIITQVYKPKDKTAARRTMVLMDELLRKTPLVRLVCNMNPDAAHTARAALTGELKI